ncbi:MAG TPA: hypothetical protein VJK08_01900 [Patescibacteria group bacterium]|nr:hypothetical protein [Patescibacteria group bacterium]
MPTTNTNLIRNVVISILTVVIALGIFLWKVLTSPQQSADQADQYQNGDK